MVDQGRVVRDGAGIRSEIRTFLTNTFKGRRIADEDDIFATGFVNSLFAMELVTYLEKTFGIAIETEDLDLDNFRSIERLGALVVRKTAANGPVPTSA